MLRESLLLRGVKFLSLWKEFFHLGRSASLLKGDAHPAQKAKGPHDSIAYRVLLSRIRLLDNVSDKIR